MRWQSVLIVLIFSFVGRESFGQRSEGDIRAVEAKSVVARIAANIGEVETVLSNSWVVDWLRLSKDLPGIEAKKLQINGAEITVDESSYYMRYGSPLAYARLLDLAITAGFECRPGSRVFDFGYGSIGHLRMLAQAGFQVVGVDVAPRLREMYIHENGPVGPGSLRVLDGRFPKDPALRDAVGSNYDLVISKNVLKRGYIHPSREVSDPRTLIDLGVDDEQFVRTIFQILKPNGLFVIYNFCPAKAAPDKPYIPWAEGECPFTKEALQQVGFEILHLDITDHFEARRLAHALGWDGPGGMNLEKDLFAWYTIVRKPQSESPSP